jgi:hypothetical protein
VERSQDRTLAVDPASQPSRSSKVHAENRTEPDSLSQHTHCPDPLPRGPLCHVRRWQHASRESIGSGPRRSLGVRQYRRRPAVTRRCASPTWSRDRGAASLLWPVAGMPGELATHLTCAGPTSSSPDEALVAEAPAPPEWRLGGKHSSGRDAVMRPLSRDCASEGPGSAAYCLAAGHRAGRATLAADLEVRY